VLPQIVLLAGYRFDMLVAMSSFPFGGSLCPLLPVLVSLCGLLALDDLQARTPRQFSTGSDLSNGANYTPPGTPSLTNDILLNSSQASLGTPGTNVSMGSIDVTNGLSYTISNTTSGSGDCQLIIGGGDGINTISPTSSDIIYVAGNSPLTLQRINGGNGIGQLSLSFLGGTLNVADPGGVLNISAGFTQSVSTQLRKIGRGTLNISGVINGMGTTVSVIEGTMNILPTASSMNTNWLDVSNPNTGPGTAVTCNLWPSVTFRAFNGTVATPSSGTNTATLNLMTAGTMLNVGLYGGNFAGVIAGNGSLSTFTGNPVFAGNNSYTGTTSVGPGGLQIDGATSGQGNYNVGSGGTLAGGGTIGLASGASVIIGNASLAPGPRTGGFATFTVQASGGGGVAFTQGTFAVDLGPSGMSDLLVINGGQIDLTSAGDSLVLTDRGGAFDGYDYTIATFAQDAGGGTFNTVQGLSGSYVVQYNPTSIKLVAPQLPLQVTSAVSRKTHGSFGPGPWDVNLLTTQPVECRSSGGSHRLIFTFSNAVVSGSAMVTAGIGQISGAPTLSGKTMTVNLIGVSDVQRLSVTLQSVTDRFAQQLPDTTFAINFLAGDVNGDRVVNSADTQIVRNNAGTAANSMNFRSDINTDGVVNSGDSTIVRAASGNGLPLAPPTGL